MKPFLLLLVIAIAVELFFKPRIDKADGKTILWYGIKKRKYIFL